MRLILKNTSSDFASLSHLLPLEKANLSACSPTEILIFLKLKNISGIVYNFKRMLKKHLAAIIKTMLQIAFSCGRRGTA